MTSPPPGPTAVRRRYCHECGTIETTTDGPVPDGWFQLSRKNPAGSQWAWERLAVFCSAACLNLAAPRIEAQHSIGDRGE